MDALVELCDLIAENPKHFPDKIAWICNRCPQPDVLLSGSPKLTRSHLNAVLGVARVLSKCGDSTDARAKSVVLEFLRAVPSSFHRSFWPQAFTNDSIPSFFSDFLAYVSKSCDISPDFSTEIAGFTGEVVLSAINSNATDETGISRVFLLALSKNFLPIVPSDADKLVTTLLDQLAATILASSREQMAVNSETSSSQSSPISTNHSMPNNSNGSASSPGNEAASQVSVSSASSKVSSVTLNGGESIFGGGSILSGGSIFGGVNDPQHFRQQVISFEDETVESLEKQEVACRLIAHVLDKVHIDSKLLEKVRLFAKRQLQFMSAFLKVKL